MQNHKSHHRQVLYHAHLTYIQATIQAIRDQKPIKKGTKIPRAKKKIQKLKKFHKIRTKKYMTSHPTPKSYNDVIGSQGSTTNNQNTQRKKKYENHQPN